jgi:NADPH:quinone reductase-like Zn-dependent oxidoreductase
MRHAVIPRDGPPDVFEVREAPDPIPGPGEIRIAVAAAGVNFTDVLARLGLYPDAPKLERFFSGRNASRSCGILQG